MTDKQYADMTTIMQLGRIFADQVQRCMEHAGLLKQGFIFSIRIETNPGDPSRILNNVNLEKSIVDVPKEEFLENAMEQYKFTENWEVYHDPRREKGTLPSEIGYKERKHLVERAGENRSKPYPPDGLWIGSCGDYSALDGWR